MSVKNDFNEVLRRWVETRVGSSVVSVRLGEYTSTYDYGGCETCGPDITKDFDIFYKTAGYPYEQSINVDGDPLSWLAYTLLNFADGIGL